MSVRKYHSSSIRGKKAPGQTVRPVELEKPELVIKSNALAKAISV